ncbi:rhodanese-related sulfurtransferase [Kiritimatiellaeota bacterium B1221]|nr:rhodanese-related sulfurtransferase [Kiritimatiellaeota bacterium B1221]
MKWTLVAFYKFFDLPDPAALQPTLLAYCEEHGICGSVLLAKEGVNGTMAGEKQTMQNWITFMEDECGFGPIDHKFSYAEVKPFRKLKVKLKSEIVHLGRPDLLPHKTKVGHYVEAKDWNRLISDPEVRVIDTRNDFECEVGTFERAENPHTEKFSEFTDYVEKNLDPKKDKKVAMFCTGGIRCEKATALLLEQGFEDVYHLKGGILKYFEEVPEEDSLWKGECFVFDDRVTVDGNLKPGETECCRGCWNPILPRDKTTPGYEEGVSCPHCFSSKTEKQLASARERERQRLLELERKQRGEPTAGQKK